DTPTPSSAASRTLLGARPAGDGAGPAEPVDLAKAHRQYGVYTGILRQKLGLQVIELAADEGLPLSRAVEDAAVIQGDTALVTPALGAGAAGRA
ncbi:unnamed protein product, partial [Lepidochelys kempii]